MIVLNPEPPLDFSFLPETLPPHREREIERIESIFISPVMDGLQTSLLIHGISGTGKTATVRYVMRRHPEISFHYINSLAHTSVRSVLNEFASGLGLVLPPGPHQLFGHFQEDSLQDIPAEETGGSGHR
ncbi:AAA family ATPase [Thermogymnomonas acidicola]|uniref:AAA family ATPase n=1 Tax=Thermogymnomonas acidicola TaxID=399579 RepID=UPI001396B8BF|nr:AAA family ATPase [Thermogymnomonas acidicola]